MAHNLKKFNSEADYNAAELNYPAVSWVTGTDAVHFDKAAPATNDKVMMAWTSADSGNISNRDIALWNGGASLPVDELFTDLTLNDVNVIPLLSDASGVLQNYAEPSTDYVVKYGLLDDSQITDIFSGDLGGGWGSSVETLDFLVPSSVTEIASLPSNTETLVINKETVPTISVDWSALSNLQNIYVPDSAVSAYQTALGAIWAGTILPMSQYSGNLPL